MKSTIARSIGTIAVVAWLSGASVLRATEHSQPCAAAREKFCSGIKPGGGALMKCLKEHEAELSDACKQRVHQAQTRGAERRKDCQPDMDRLCSAAKGGHGAMMKCLHAHEAELSVACKAAITRSSPH